jgi:hypothetical protein
MQNGNQQRLNYNSDEDAFRYIKTKKRNSFEAEKGVM